MNESPENFKEYMRLWNERGPQFGKFVISLFHKPEYRDEKKRFVLIRAKNAYDKVASTQTRAAPVVASAVETM